MKKYVKRELKDEEIDMFIKENMDVISEVKNKAMQHFGIAKEALNSFPDNKYKEIMLRLLDNIANRKY